MFWLYVKQSLGYIKKYVEECMLWYVKFVKKVWVKFTKCSPGTGVNIW